MEPDVTRRAPPVVRLVGFERRPAADDGALRPTSCSAASKIVVPWSEAAVNVGSAAPLASNRPNPELGKQPEYQ